MRRKDLERQSARQMRAAGASLREIARELKIALSSASSWTRDVAPTPVETRPIEAAADRSGAPSRDRSEYFRDRGELHKRQTYEARSRRRELARAYVIGLLTSKACADCGLADPVVLEFDHVQPKRAEVAVLVTHGYSLRRITAEIDRCEIVCANCHRHRTAARKGWLRTGSEAPDYSINRPLRRRNTEFVRDYLATHPCVDCREPSVVVLEFDHVGKKRATVAKLVQREHSLDSIRREIGECEVRCANCHRRKTCRTLGHFRQNADAPVAQLVRARAF